MGNNLFEHKYQERNKKPVIWLTGLSASGKSTIASKLEARLLESGYLIKVLDGDNIRMGLNKDLGFSDEDRKENIRRISEVAKLFSESNNITVTSFISPFTVDRDLARQIMGDNFIEVYVKASLDVCERRDPKGLYKRARMGDIKQFTGIDSPYEEPINPELILDTTLLNIDECVQKLLNYLASKGFVDSKLFKTPWEVINHGNTKVVNNGKQRAVFIGRYQPYHYGHIRLIEQKLRQGIPALIMVRDIQPDDKNPFTTYQTVKMILKYHKSKGQDVEVVIIPDIESVNYGRGVGYEVNEYTPPKDIEMISATYIRDCISHETTSGNLTDWRESVDEIIQEDIVNYINQYEINKYEQSKNR